MADITRWGSHLNDPRPQISAAKRRSIGFMVQLPLQSCEACGNGRAAKGRVWAWCDLHRGFVAAHGVCADYRHR